MKKNENTGMYEAVKYDSNAIIHDYKFSFPQINGLSYSIGNWVAGKGTEFKITATKEAAKEIERRNYIVSSATGYLYDINSQDLTVWGDYWDSSIQKFVSLVNNDIMPIPISSQLRKHLPLLGGDVKTVEPPFGKLIPKGALYLKLLEVETMSMKTEQKLNDLYQKLCQLWYVKLQQEKLLKAKVKQEKKEAKRNQCKGHRQSDEQNRPVRTR